MTAKARASPRPSGCSTRCAPMRREVRRPVERRRCRPSCGRSGFRARRRGGAGPGRTPCRGSGYWHREICLGTPGTDRSCASFLIAQAQDGGSILRIPLRQPGTMSRRGDGATIMTQSVTLPRQVWLVRMLDGAVSGIAKSPGIFALATVSLYVLLMLPMAAYRQFDFSIFILAGDKFVHQ